MKFIIPMIVGAIIGYITNWLAIKMLFRPHEEKRFLGLHIPFTPGLIPKERSRIAKSVGETVGVYLLSPEVIMNSISDNKIEAYIKRWIESNIYKLKKEDRSIKLFISDLSHNNYDNIFKHIKNKIVDFICAEIRKDKFKQVIINYINKHIIEKCKESLYKFIDERFEALLFELFTSNETRNLLKSSIKDKFSELTQDERRLYEIIPEDFIYTIKYYIKKYDDDIANVLRNILNDSSMEMKIKESINNHVSKNMNRIVAVFMSSEIITDKAYRMIKEYVNKPQINENIIDMLTTAVDKILESRVDNVSKEILSEIGEEEILKISDSILEYISNGTNQKKVLDIIRQKIKSKELEVQNEMLNLIYDEVERVLNSEELYNNIYTVVDSTVEVIINRPISSIVENINETSVTNITKFCTNILNNFIENELPNIVDMFNISKVVEDQINSYDVSFAEELIVEIAHRELRAITWLGALLGGIMGLLSPLLQMINV